MATESSLSDSAAANLVSAMSTLVQDTDLADFTVTCGEMTWKLHANILALLSPFFKAAITTNMIEKLEMKIDIQDLDPKTMEEVVYYMYGKPIGNAPINFLFEAAERFQMCDLKKDVTKLARQRMAEDNVVEFAKLAEMYDDEDFLKECAGFIVKKDIYLTADLSPKVTKIVFALLNGNLKEAKEELTTETSRLKKEAKEELATETSRLKNKMKKYLNIPSKSLNGFGIVYPCIVCDERFFSEDSVVNHLINFH